MKNKSIHKVLVQTFNHWSKNGAPTMGAAISYYAVFAVIPLLSLIVAASTIFFDKNLVEHTLSKELFNIFGGDTARYINNLLNNIQVDNLSLRATFISAGTLIIATMGMFGELYKDLNQLWHSPASTHLSKNSNFVKKIWSFLKERVSILSIIPLLLILFLTSILSSLFFGALQNKIQSLIFLDDLLPLIQILISFILSTLLFILIYHFFPRRKLKWSYLLIGSIFTSVLFVTGNILISLYLNFAVNLSTYGAASTLMGILIWIYYSAQVFFLGASFTYIYSNEADLIDGSRQ